MDTSALTGTTISIKEEPLAVKTEVDRKPMTDAGDAGPELGESSDLGDGASAAGLLGQEFDVKQDPSCTGLVAPTKPLVKKGMIFIGRSNV